MMRGKTRVIFSLLLAVLLLAGCGGKGGLVGKWVVDGGGGVIEFFSDGTCTMLGHDAEYTVTDEGVIQLSRNGDTLYVEYEVSGETLTLIIEGESTTLTKQK